MHKCIHACKRYKVKYSNNNSTNNTYNNILQLTFYAHLFESFPFRVSKQVIYSIGYLTWTIACIQGNGQKDRGEIGVSQLRWRKEGEVYGSMVYKHNIIEDTYTCTHTIYYTLYIHYTVPIYSIHNTHNTRIIPLYSPKPPSTTYGTLPASWPGRKQDRTMGRPV